jgi:Flp pilus assembly protein TadD
MSASDAEKDREFHRLAYDVRWGIAHGFGARDLVPMLERLIACAPPESQESDDATLELAQLIVETAPWKAALACRRVLARMASDRALGILGLALSVMGHHRAACGAYWRALALRPDGVEYAHNLGHLLDVALDDPRSALRLLERAHRAEPNDAELAGSYAHALIRVGRVEDAKKVLLRGIGSEARTQELLRRWQGG